jgi:hypothetical protein
MITSRRLRWVGHVVYMVEKIYPHRRFIERKRPLRRHRHRWQYDAEKGLIEIRCNLVKYIQLAQGRAFVKSKLTFGFQSERKRFKQLNNYQLFKEDFTQCSVILISWQRPIGLDFVMQYYHPALHSKIKVHSFKSHAVNKLFFNYLDVLITNMAA